MKKTKFILFAVVPLMLGIGGCVSTGDTGPEYLVTYHNSRNSLDWAGVYAGVIPSASGSGIEVRITLNLDYTFEMRYRYIDRNGEFLFTGTFVWDDTGGIITLDSGNRHSYYRVGENILIMLDSEGNRIIGNLEENYILRKEF